MKRITVVNITVLSLLLGTTSLAHRQQQGDKKQEQRGDKRDDNGADLLRRAVNYGYAEGFRSGAAGRLDRWQFSYQDGYAYQDANFGYNGYYVKRDDYNFYVREGFRRGYEDGFNSRYQYGRYTNG